MKGRATAERRGWTQGSTLLGIGLFAACLALYVSTRSISLDDFDSFNFARAIGHFDVSLNQPQAPGYPVYIFLARLLDLPLHDRQTALTLLSAISGAVAVLAFYGLARDLGAGWAALPLAVMPLFWLSSEMALSDVPGLCFAIVSVFLLNRRSSRSVVAGCALAGIAAGVRPQDAIVPLSVLIFVTAPRVVAGDLVGRASEKLGVEGFQPSEVLPKVAALRGWRLLAAGVAAFGLACLAWAAPLVISLGGIPPALATMAGQSHYVGSTDGLLARPLTPADVAVRLAEFGSAFSGYFGGPRDGGLAAFVALAVVTAVLAVFAGRARRLALAWLLPYTVFMILTLRPDDPRKILPAIPALLLLLAAGRWRSIVCAGLAVAFIVAAAPLIRTLDTVPAPPEQAAAYIASHYQAQDTVIVAGSSFNAIRYRDPAFKSYLIDILGHRGPDLSAAKTLIVLDKEGYTPPASWVGSETKTFERDPLVLPKAAEVWMAVYQPLPSIDERELTVAAPVHIGTPDDVRYLLDGWNRPEVIAGVPARWSDRQSRLRFFVNRAADATLTLVGIAYPPRQQLTVLVNGQPAGHLAMSQDWAPYNILLPATLFHAGAINTITLEHSMVTSAFEATHGQSLDRRPLAAAYQLFEITWR